MQYLKAEEGHCIWYGECGSTSSEKPGGKGKPLNCVYNGAAKPMKDDEGQKLLQELCPSIAKEAQCKIIFTSSIVADQAFLASAC